MDSGYRHVIKHLVSKHAYPIGKHVGGVLFDCFACRSLVVKDRPPHLRRDGPPKICKYPDVPVGNRRAQIVNYVCVLTATSTPMTNIARITTNTLDANAKRTDPKELRGPTGTQPYPQLGNLRQNESATERMTI